MTDETRTRFEQQDPGAYIGNEPEREGETIPGGRKPGDERVAAHDSQPGVDGEPDDTEMPPRGQDSRASHTPEHATARRE